MKSCHHNQNPRTHSHSDPDYPISQTPALQSEMPRYSPQSPIQIRQDPLDSQPLKSRLQHPQSLLNLSLLLARKRLPILRLLIVPATELRLYALDLSQMAQVGIRIERWVLGQQVERRLRDGLEGLNDGEDEVGCLMVTSCLLRKEGDTCGEEEKLPERDGDSRVNVASSDIRFVGWFLFHSMVFRIAATPRAVVPRPVTPSAPHAVAVAP